MSRLSDMQESLEPLGFYVSTYSPGDGVTRYRFFNQPGNSYFGSGDGIHTALGISDAESFTVGLCQGYEKARRDLETINA